MVVREAKCVRGNMSFLDGPYDMKNQPQEGAVLVFISQVVKRKCK